MKTPCQYCEERHEACHGHCEKYIAWKAEHERIKANDKARKKESYYKPQGDYWDKVGRRDWRLKKLKRRGG